MNPINHEITNHDNNANFEVLYHNESERLDVNHLQVLL